MERKQKLVASLLLAATVSTLVGCDAKNLANAANNFAKSETGKSLIHQAALALKTVDENGLDIQYTEDQVLAVTVGGKEVAAKFDDNGYLLVEGLKEGQEENVVVKLKDGQQVTMPLKPEAGDFKGNQPPKFEAFVMPGHKDNQLYGEVRRPGQAGGVSDLFKGKAVKVELNKPALTNESLRRLSIGQFNVPRQTIFVEQGNLMMHPSNLWVIMQAGARPGQPPAGQPGTQPMQPMQPGTQPMPGTQPQPGTQPPMFSVMQLQQPTMQPSMQPGGMQPSMQPGGMQPGTPPTVAFHLVAEPQAGKFMVYSFKVERAPGPPPLDANGQVPVFIQDKPPSVRAEQIKDLKEMSVVDLTQFEKETVQARMDGKFLPPPPPQRPAGQAPAPTGR